MQHLQKIAGEDDGHAIGETGLSDVEVTGAYPGAMQPLDGLLFGQHQVGQGHWKPEPPG